MAKIRYRSGYKYQLAETIYHQTSIHPDTDIKTKFISLSAKGRLTIKVDYAWDGASGPTWDTLNSMRGSCIHDALYQLMRQEELEPVFRFKADEELRNCLLDDGMWSWRASLWVRELRKFGGSAADPKNVKKVYEAP